MNPPEGALHVTPDALEGGPIARLHDGDMIRLDAEAGTLEVMVPDEELAGRPLRTPDLSANEYGFGRELFAGFRENAAALVPKVGYEALEDAKYQECLGKLGQSETTTP